MCLFLLFVRNAYLQKKDENPHGLAEEDEDDDNDDDLCESLFLGFLKRT